MKKQLFGAAALAFAISGLAMAPSEANAAQYISYLEYKNDAPNTLVANEFGTVTLTEIAPNKVDVVVHLISPLLGFINTGNDNKSPFTFNLTGDYDVVTINDVPAGQQFVDGGFGAFQNNNFGTYTNKIDCCGGQQGGGHYDPTDLHFTVTNTAIGGTLTFAGLGATFFPNGRLNTVGSGPRFNSTQTDPTGWWFSADVVQTGGSTYNIAARDAFRVIGGGAPEPASWALMLMGFGGLGAVLRSRRKLALA